MSKKKNTLRDLDQFLKQQAAALVTPPRLNQAEDQSSSKEEELPPITSSDNDNVSMGKLLNDLQLLARKEGPNFRHQLYDLLIISVEAQNEYSPEDRMLINTALYLKSGERWQDVIREYWRNKNQSK